MKDEEAELRRKPAREGNFGGETDAEVEIQWHYETLQLIASLAVVDAKPSTYSSARIKIN